jgi:GNAT superfamily N-acetyltransferase
MASELSLIIRRAEPRDVPALGRLGAMLMRAHFAFDAQRFLAPGDNPDEGYARFLHSQLPDENVSVFVAERGGEIIGYVYAGLEPQSWRELRDFAGFIHDIVVEEGARRTGAATALIDAAIAWIRSRGAPRVILWTADQNTGAQQLFDRLGFRRTMIEMTREL